MTLLLRAAVVLLAAQAALLWTAEPDPSAGLAVAARAALAVVIVFAVLDVSRALIASPKSGDGSRTEVVTESGASDQASVRPVGSHRAGGTLASLVTRVRPWHLLVVGLVLLAAPSVRSPARLVVNAVGFLAFAGPLWWIVQRGAGQRAATLALGATAIFATVALTAERPTRRFVEDWGAASAYKWSAGWPTSDWRLSQTITLPPGRDRPANGFVLVVPLAQRYGGTSSVMVTVNGADAGAARLVQGQTQLVVDVPAGRVGQDGELRIELRAVPPDPTLRVMALRWTGGATRGAGASSYFDGAQWRAGTFNDAAGRAQLGVYVVRLEPAGNS